MRYLLLAVIGLLLSGCATFNHKLTYWSDYQNVIKTADGQTIYIIGNPRITCYTQRDGKEVIIADGLFVRQGADYMNNVIVVDEFGKDYVYVTSDDNYCILWK